MSSGLVEGPRAQPWVIPRSVWGAGEPLHLDQVDAGCPSPNFWPTQKLIVHHTAGGSDHSDPAAAIRWIHRLHTVTRGWEDLGYNFLIDASGAVYEGRFSGEHRSGQPVGVNAAGDAVAAAHTGGFNAGTIGIALLGNFSQSPLPADARDSLIDLLAWSAAVSRLDPEGFGTYVNPVTGFRAALPNIAGHRDIAATECPGDHAYEDLALIRASVTALLSAPPDPVRAARRDSASAGTSTAPGGEGRR